MTRQLGMGQNSATMDSQDGSFLEPSGYVNSLLSKMTIEIVSFPIKDGVFP